MNANRAEKKRLPDLPMAPMIDCVFQLLIFFMVTTVFAVTPGLDIKLPEAEESEAPPQENLFIVIDKDGNMKLNHRTVQMESLQQEIENKRKQLDNTTVLVIQADEKTYHGIVVKVMDIAKKAGIEDLVIATEKPEEEKG